MDIEMLERNVSVYKSSKIFGIASSIVVLFYIVPKIQQGNKLYYLGFLLVLIFTIVAIASHKLEKKSKLQLSIKENWGKVTNKKRDFLIISSLNSNLESEKKDSFYIDNQTWQDLTMDKIYALLDRTHTSAGQMVLYNMLRTPLFDTLTLEKRNILMNFFKTNPELREKIEYELARAGNSNESNIPYLLWNPFPNLKKYKIPYYILSYLPIFAICTYPIIGPPAFIYLVLLCVVNMFMHYMFFQKVSIDSPTITELALLVKASKKIGNLEVPELEEYTKRLNEISKLCIKISKKSGIIAQIEGNDPITDYISMLTLSKEKAFITTVTIINKYTSELKEAFQLVGMLDALISITSYREGLKSYTVPKLELGKNFLQGIDLSHPLIENAVTNSVEIDNGGIVLTGSNMSGKSTFLRTIGINALFAQTIATCLATSYAGSFFKIITSISPEDDIIEGKSYYLGEAEALLRIIKGCNNEIPSICIIDEIFRGTNPIERISASTEILDYLSKSNTIVVVATHDLEITELVSNYYQCYYFSEDVDDNGMKFDYTLKKGISPTRNAIKILKYLGYPEEIINNTNNRLALISK